MPYSVPTAHVTFPPDAYPLTIEAIHPITKVAVWFTVIQLPPADGFVIAIPPVAERCGHPVLIRITYATGEILESDEPLGMPDEIGLYLAAQRAVDEVFGPGSYALINGFDPSLGETRASRDSSRKRQIH